MNEPVLSCLQSELSAIDWDDFSVCVSQSRILVIGDLMLDHYIWGDTRRISPEAPVPVVEVKRRTVSPGGAANTAANIAALGGNVLIAGIVGDDPEGETLREKLRVVGVKSEAVLTDRTRPTTSKVRIIARNQQVVRFDTEVCEPLQRNTESALITIVKGLIAQVDGCVISDYGKGVITPSLAAAAIGTAQIGSKFTVVDPKGLDYSKYCGATLVAPNLSEAEQILHMEIADKNNLLDAGATLCRLMKSAVLITRGADGMSLFEDSRHTHIPALARNVFDVTGAGDTAVGTLAIALAAGLNMRQAAALANLAAGIVVGKVGTATVSLEELRTASNKL